MKLLILGGTGRLGGAFQRVFTSGELFAPSRIELDPSDLTAFIAYLQNVQPDAIVNCIAYNMVDLAEGTGQEEAYRLNVALPETLAKAAAIQAIPLVHISTDYVFSGEKEDGYKEMDEANPINVYGVTKYKGEQAVLASSPHVYVVRTSRLYGPLATSANTKKSFIELILEDASRSAYVLVNPSEYSAPTYVDDLARHIIEEILVKKAEPGIYHLVNEGGVSWLEWAQEIGAILELPVTFAPRDLSTIQRPALRPTYSVLKNTKLSPMRPWKDALRDMMHSSALTYAPRWKSVGIEGVAIEPMPRIGAEDGAVLHMLPGGVLNPHGFGSSLKDVYAFTAKGKNTFRGGHYHLKLDELFFQFSGTALWIFSDFRESSSTYGKTASITIDIEQWIVEGSFPRIRVPAGVYHAIFPLTDERMMSVGIGSTAYDKEDYRHPAPQDVPDLLQILARHGIHPSS